MKLASFNQRRAPLASADDSTRPRHMRRALITAGAAATFFLSFLTVVLSTRALLLLALSLCLSAVAVSFAVSDFHRRGAWAKLSPLLRTKLLRTNLLEWLFDDGISRKLAPFMPFLLGMSDEELKVYLQQAPAEVRETMLRPGLVHLLPIGLQTLLLGTDRLQRLHQQGTVDPDVIEGSDTAAASDVSATAGMSAATLSDGGIHTPTTAASSSAVAGAQQPIVTRTYQLPFDHRSWSRPAMQMIIRRRVMQSFDQTLSKVGLSSSNTLLSASVVGSAVAVGVLTIARKRLGVLVPGAVKGIAVSVAVLLWMLYFLRRRADTAMRQLQIPPQHTAGTTRSRHTLNATGEVGQSTVAGRTIDAVTVADLITRARAMQSTASGRGAAGSAYHQHQDAVSTRPSSQAQDVRHAYAPESPISPRVDGGMRTTGAAIVAGRQLAAAAPGADGSQASAGGWTAGWKRRLSPAFSQPDLSSGSISPEDTGTSTDGGGNATGGGAFTVAGGTGGRSHAGGGGTADGEPDDDFEDGDIDPDIEQAVVDMALRVVQGQSLRSSLSSSGVIEESTSVDANSTGAAARIGSPSTIVNGGVEANLEATTTSTSADGLRRRRLAPPSDLSRPPLDDSSSLGEAIEEDEYAGEDDDDGGKDT